jgi:hypothetical protein
MPTPNLQLIGGSYQDETGAPLSFGYILLELSHDEQETTDPGIVSGAIKKRITLDINGSIPALPPTLIWSNDVLLPANSFYIVRWFKQDGTEADKYQQYWQLAATPSPLNVGSIVPTNPPNGLTQLTPVRVASINFQIDGGGSTPGTGVKGQISIPTSCTLTGWVITADQTGSAVVDILRSTYAAFPTTSSIAGTDKPTLTSQRKNEDLTLTGWGSKSISSGDIIQFSLSSVSTVTFIDVTLNVTIP